MLPGFRKNEELHVEQGPGLPRPSGLSNSVVSRDRIPSASELAHKDGEP